MRPLNWIEAQRLLPPLLGLMTAPALAATFNLSNGDYPACSTTWSASGATYSCVNNGRVTLNDGDNIIANSDATLVANDGFALGNGSIGTSTNRIDLQADYGNIQAEGTSIYGDITASSSLIDLDDADVFGSITTGGDIQLQDGSVDGLVTSQSNTIQSQGTNLLGGANASGNLSIQGGSLSGDFTSDNGTANFQNVNLTEGSVSAGDTVTFQNSTVGSAVAAVPVTTDYGDIRVQNNTTLYGDLTGPSYADIDVSSDSVVYGTCSPSSPGCQPPPPESCSLAPGLSGQYYDNTNLAGEPAFERIDDEIDFNWGSGSPDSAELGNNTFSIRWSGYVLAQRNSQNFRTWSDDGVRLYVDGNPVIENWTDHGVTDDTGNASITSGEYIPVVLEYYENAGSAVIELQWEIRGGGPPRYVTLPPDRLFHCDSLLPQPVLEWRQDEAQWDGSAGEVEDSSGSGNHGTAFGGATTAAGQICRAGEFDGVDDYVRLEDGLYDTLSGTASLSFWIRTTQNGNDTPYLAPGVTGVEQNGGTDDIFWGWLDASGRIGLSVGNNTTSKSVRSVNDGTFHHVVLMRDADNGDYRIYIDGTRDADGTMATGEIGSYFESLGRVEVVGGGSPNYFQGRLDEVVMFDRMLSDSQVQILYDYQSQGKNLDGEDRDVSNCSATPQTCFNSGFDGSLDGDDWRTLSSSGNFTPQVTAGRLRLTRDGPNIATAATLLRQFPSAGNRVVVEFDYYAYKDNGSTDAADGVVLVLSDRDITPYPGSFGGSLGYAQRDNGDPGFQGGWLGIGLDEYGNFSNPTEGREGGPGQRPNAIAIRGSGSGTDGYVYLEGTAANLNPSVITEEDSPHRYRLTLDHTDGVRALVTVERDSTGNGSFDTLIASFDALADPDQAAIPDRVVVTLTGSTGGSSANHEIDNLEVCANTLDPYEAPIHHFELVRGQTQGLTCEPLSVALRACTDADCTDEYDQPFDATLEATRLADGTVRSVSATSLSSGDALDILLQPAGDYELSLPTSTPSASALTENSCYLAGSTTAEADCIVNVADTGLRFFDTADPGATLGVFDLIAALEDGPYGVQAVETNTETGICEGLFAAGDSLDFSAGTSCDDPATCSSGQQVSLSNEGDTTVLPNPENPVGGNDTTILPLTFGADSIAEFNLNAPDVGIQPLTLAFELPDENGDPSGEVISQSVNLRVRPAELRLQSFQDGDGNALDTGTVGTDASTAPFTEAGAPFTLAVQALNADGDPTPNFGRTSSLPTLDWGTLSQRVLPAPPDGSGEVEGSIDATTPGVNWQIDSGDSSRIEMDTGANLRFTDLGIVQLQGRIEDYLGSGQNVDSDAHNVGRFIPAYLGISQAGTANWGTEPYRYQGQAGDLTGLALDVTAFDTAGNALDNYDGGLFRLDLDTPDLLERPASLAATGTALDYDSGDIAWTRSDDGDYDGTVRLTLDNLPLTWPRKTPLPDAQDTPHDVTDFHLTPSAATDEDGVCTGAPCAGADLLIATVELLYGRAHIDRQASGTEDNLILPARAEYLASVDTSVSPTEFSFNLHAGDSETGNTELPGLTAEGTCLIQGMASPGTTCASIADTADGNLTGLTGGSGYFTLDGLGNRGIVGVRADAPAWLEWDWDQDSGTAMTGPPATLYFGQYTGRPPLLFQSDGFR